MTGRWNMLNDQSTTSLEDLQSNTQPKFRSHLGLHPRRSMRNLRNLAFYVRLYECMRPEVLDLLIPNYIARIIPLVACL